ncbi:hypothetical protein Tco_1092096 [Tanacetum coccineum]|uniref:Uncharacterized protein n=1 Tax=Tanacetum coccineum TaxID=301880 RepID=A0ABQ5IB18_9ASTR
MSGEEPVTQIAPVESPQMVSTVKLRILKKGEYTLWSMRMKQYLTNTDYSLWQVILNGDGPIQKSIDERAKHKREYDIRVNERQIQTTEGKVDTYQTQYDEEPMAEVQTTAEINVFATGQQHTEQPEFNN